MGSESSDHKIASNLLPMFYHDFSFVTRKYGSFLFLPFLILLQFFGLIICILPLERFPTLTHYPVDKLTKQILSQKAATRISDKKPTWTLFKVKQLFSFWQAIDLQKQSDFLFNFSQSWSK